MRVTAPRRLHEIGRFLVVGGAAFVVQFGVLNAVLAVGVEALAANVVATCCSVAFAYAGNRRWSFAHRAGADRRRELLAFVAVNAVTLVVSESLLAVVHAVGAQHDLRVVNGVTVVGTAIGTALRYVGYRRLVFRRSAAADTMDDAGSGSAPWRPGRTLTGRVSGR